MRSRPELLVAALLTVLALGVTSAAATLGLREAGSLTGAHPAARLPAVLFAPEPPTPVAPVRPEISADVASADDALGLAPAAASNPVARRRPQRGPSAATDPTPHLTITLSYVASPRSQQRTITYTATIHNQALVALQGLELGAHVPPGTRWLAGTPCRGDGRPLALAYGDAAPVFCCIPAPKPGEEPLHEVVVLFDRPVPSRGTAAATYTVEVDPGVASVENHVHVRGPGVDGESPPLIVEAG